MIKQYLPFLVLLAAVSISVDAQQQILFDQKLDKSFLFRKSDYADETQLIFQKLAEGQNRPVSSVEFTLSFEQRSRVLRTNPSHILTSAEAKDFSVKGDVFYKGFDLSEFLLPDVLSFTSTLTAGNKSLPPVTRQERVKIINGKTERAENTFTDSLNNDWKLELSQHRFTYSHTALTDFGNRIALISDYYTASSEIEQLHQRLQTVNPSDIDRLDFQNENLRSIEKSISQMEARNFERNLDLPSFDPLRFRPRFEALKNEAFAIRSDVNETKSTLYIHFYNTALDLQARGKNQMARTYFSKSLHENPLFAPAAYQLALMNYNEGNYAGADDQGTDIVNQMNPDPDIRRLTIELLNSTYRRYLSEAEQFIGQRKYAEALTLLDRASRLCRHITGIPCSEAMDLNYRKAHNGQYQKILDNARAAYQQGDLSRAENSIRDALNYQERYQAHIPNAGDALAMQKGIRQKRYDVLVDAGKTNIRQQAYEKALDNFRDADALQQRYGLNANADLDNYKKMAAKPLMLSKIKRGKEVAGATNLGEARKLSKEILSMQNQYGLAADKEIIKEYGELKSAIFSQECVHAQNEFDRYAGQMRDAIRKKNYIEADRQYSNADRVLQDNSECSLNSGTLRAEHDSVIPAYVYQALNQEVLRLQTNGSYADAAAKYKEADTYFHHYEVSQFGLRHAPLAEFAAAQCNNDFLMFLGNLFLRRKEYESSLTTYKALLERGVSPGYFKDPLYKLGTELALRDRKVTPAANPKQKVLDYTAGDKRLKKLYKGYLKGWKTKP